MIARSIHHKEQVKFIDCKYKRCLPFDFGIYDDKNNLKGLIEYQGEQHYRPLKYFGGERKFSLTKQRDNIKKQYCEENKIPLLIVSYICYNEIDLYISRFIKYIL